MNILRAWHIHSRCISFLCEIIEFFFREFLLFFARAVQPLIEVFSQPGFFSLPVFALRSFPVRSQSPLVCE